MGARQSRRSVDITTTPKKEGLPVEGVIIGDGAAPGDGKLEKIEEADAKPTTNGVAPHTDAASTNDDKDKDKDEATEKEKEKDEESKAVEPKVEQSEAESAVEGVAPTTAATTTTTATPEVTTPTEGTPASPTTTTSPDSKETKKKDKPKKKWSFRSISFSRKDKSKPAREDTPKNGDVTKEEPLPEGGEEAEAAASSPAEDKSAVSSPTEQQQELNGTAAAADASTGETKVEEEDKSATTVAAPAAAAAVAAAAATATVAASVADEKKEEPSTPAPTPVPVEAKKVEEVEKQQQQQVEPANADKTVESTPEADVPVENNIVANDIGTTENNDEAPKSPPPAIPAEAPPAPTLGPAITEDVASVTKAIEEIDINEKAVAAAVNENESANTNEIMADMNHHNNMNE